MEKLLVWNKPQPPIPSNRIYDDEGGCSQSLSILFLELHVVEGESRDADDLAKCRTSAGSSCFHFWQNYTINTFFVVG